MIQFYAPEIANNPVLPESDSQHCIRVLRMQAGDTLSVVDGCGSRYLCRIIDAHPKHALVEIVEREELPLTWQQSISIAIAPTKNIDRMEWLVEKLVEIGVNRIIPIRCQCSERKDIKVERLQKIAVSAMKQSLKAHMPQISEMMPYAEALKTLEASQKFIAYCDDEIPRQIFASAYQPGADVLVLIGPEGDFAPQEIKMALQNGYAPVTFGNNRLRTETAALYACTAIHVLDELAEHGKTK